VVSVFAVYRTANNFGLELKVLTLQPDDNLDIDIILELNRSVPGCAGHLSSAEKERADPPAGGEEPACRGGEGLHATPVIPLGETNKA
jgi:hypothetical protein